MKKFLFCAFAMHCAVTSVAQHDIEKYLLSVAANNKSIIANKKYWQSKKAEFTTGLTLSDPQIEYDYLFGSPAGSGNQKDFAVTQRMDFPTAYAGKKRLSRQQVLQADVEQLVYQQDLLLRAKLVYLQKIYLNKKTAMLERRLDQLTQLQGAVEKKLVHGEAIILDLNRIKLEVLELLHELTVSRSENDNVQTRLDDLNGGIAFRVTDTIYPFEPQVPDFATIDSIIESNDPVLKVYDHERKIAEHQIKIQKAMRLPSLEFGYHSQTILGQSYRGVHSGIALPLWENRNKLKAARLSLDYIVANTERHLEEHRCENKELYNDVITNKRLIGEYQIALSGVSDNSLLTKALSMGQLTVIDYLAEQRFYYASVNKFLEIELDYHKACAALFKIYL